MGLPPGNALCGAGDRTVRRKAAYKIMIARKLMDFKGRRLTLLPFVLTEDPSSTEPVIEEKAGVCRRMSKRQIGVCGFLIKLLWRRNPSVSFADSSVLHTLRAPLHKGAF